MGRRVCAVDSVGPRELVSRLQTGEEGVGAVPGWALCAGARVTCGDAAGPREGCGMAGSGGTLISGRR